MEKVTSKDGTEIAYDTYGSGPVLVLVAGGFTDRARYVPDAEALASTFTVVNYDRRGRGDSGDAPTYAVEREWEDLDAVRSATGARFACAYSSGSMVLFQAGLPFEKQAVMEPPFRVEERRRRRIGISNGCRSTSRPGTPAVRPSCSWSRRSASRKRSSIRSGRRRCGPGSRR